MYRDQLPGLPHQTLLRFSMPAGARLFPNDFRELLARTPGFEDAGRLFHRDESGRTRNGPPEVLVTGGRTWVGLLAQPHAHTELTQVVARVALALSRHFGAPVPMQMSALKVSARPADFPVNYRLREVALKIRYAPEKAMSLEEVVRKRLLSGLARLAAGFGVDLPPDDELDARVAIRRQRGVRLVVSTGATREWLTVVDADVSMFCELNGIWTLGNLTSRGYGRLIREAPVIARDARFCIAGHPGGLALSDRATMGATSQ